MKESNAQEENPYQHEYREQEILSRGPWLGGFFEIAGTISLQQGTTKRQTKSGINEHTYVYPLISYTDDNSERIFQLKNIFGGAARPRDGNSWVWVIRGRQAIPIAEVMEPYAPSRKEILHAIQNVQNAEFLEEQQAILYESREYQHLDDISIDEYMELVKDDGFVAGVLDARGSLARREVYNTEENISWIYPRINVSSTNRPLLEALEETYGGQVSTVFTEGTDTVIKGVSTTVRKDTLNWRVETKDIRNLFQKISLHLLFRSDDYKSMLGIN